MIGFVRHIRNLHPLDDFRLLFVAQIPDMINWFGWCTWDAFYTDVTEEGLKLGLERFHLFLDTEM